MNIDPACLYVNLNSSAVVFSNITAVIVESTIFSANLRIKSGRHFPPRKHFLNSWILAQHIHPIHKDVCWDNDIDALHNNIIAGSIICSFISLITPNVLRASSAARQYESVALSDDIFKYRINFYSCGELAKACL